MKKVFIGLGAVLLCLLLALLACVTFSREGFLPGFLSVGAYPVRTGVYGDLLPRGSLALTEKDPALSVGDIVVLPMGGERVIGSVLTAEEDSLTVRVADAELRADASQVLGRVYYELDGLGDFCVTLKNNRTAVWCALALLTAAAVAFVVTIPSRRHKAEVKKLIELFDYYGNKFDEEEKDIEY